MQSKVFKNLIKQAQNLYALCLWAVCLWSVFQLPDKRHWATIIEKKNKGGGEDMEFPGILTK